MTRAPFSSAIVCEPSALPLSATMISPAIPELWKAVVALRMQVWRVSASFRQGMTTETSGGSSVRWMGDGLGLISSWLTVSYTATRLDKVIQSLSGRLDHVVGGAHPTNVRPVAWYTGANLFQRRFMNRLIAFACVLSF